MLNRFTEKIVGQRSRGNDPFESKTDCSCFGVTDEDWNKPTRTRDLAQNENWGITRDINLNVDDFHLNHRLRLPGPKSNRTRESGLTQIVT
jgi:hypothetical protein